eukprot:704640-Pleurochrysis_carterae.AAC.1
MTIRPEQYASRFCACVVQATQQALARRSELCTRLEAQLLRAQQGMQQAQREALEAKAESAAAADANAEKEAQACARAERRSLSLALPHCTPTLISSDFLPLTPPSLVNLFLLSRFAHALPYSPPSSRFLSLPGQSPSFFTVPTSYLSLP